MLDELEEYQELIEGLSEFIANEESVGVAHHNRAVAYWEIGKIEEALQDFSDAEKQLPENHMPSQIKGMLLEKLGRYEEALIALDRAVSISPNQATVRRTRAHLLVKMGKFEASLSDFNRAIKLEPSFKQTVQDRKKVLARLSAAGNGSQQKKWWQVWKP